MQLPAIDVETVLYGVNALCLWSLLCRGSPAPVLTEAPGSSSAGDVSCDVEGGLPEEHRALWESGGVCVLGH